jgi:hypothetical protein
MIHAKMDVVVQRTEDGVNLSTAKTFFFASIEDTGLKIAHLIRN